MTDTYIRSSFEPVKPLLLVDAVQAFNLFLHTSSLPEPEAKRIFNELAAEYLQTQKPPVKDTKTLYDYFLLIQNSRAFQCLFLICALTFFAVIFLGLCVFLNAASIYLLVGGGAFFILVLFSLFKFMDVC